MATDETPNTSEREARIGQILDAYLERRATGRAEPEAALLAAHPDLADALRWHLEVVRHLRPAGGDIQALVAQGVLQPGNGSACPATLGPYQITGFLGRGGMGVVLEAHEESLDRRVALKILRLEYAGDRSAVSRFEQEAKAAAAIRHPNIVTIHAVGACRNTRYLAMERIDGPSLAEIIRQCRALPTETVRVVFRQLHSGLAVAHDAGLIHRDVKPSNILIDQPRNGRQPATPALDPENIVAKLADFGLARMASAQTRMTLTGSAIGTPEYMSPEQARGDDDIDHRTDLYSAGVVLYEMLTGRTPFRGESPTAVLHGIINVQPEDPLSLNPEADAVLASLATALLAKQRDDRPSSATEVMAALDAGRRLKAPLRTRARRRSSILVAVSAVAVLIGGVWLASLWNSAEPLTGVVSEVNVDRGTGKSLLIRLDDEPDWHVLRTFEQPLSRGCVALAHAAQHAFIGLGLRDPLDDPDSVLLIWRDQAPEPLALSLRSDLHWPDCAPPRKWWNAAAVQAADVDNDGSDEFIVVTQDPAEYPMRVSIVDPATGAIRSTFWHFGHLGGLIVLDRFFDDTRPAILIWGENNKLDGFNGPNAYRGPHAADWDHVPVMMILDPLAMDGLGPPYERPGPDIPAAIPFAYAYANVPPQPETLPAANRSGPESTPPPFHGAWTIRQVRRSTANNDRPDSEPWLQIQLMDNAEGTAKVDAPYLMVDRTLRLQEFGPPPPSSWRAGTLAFWRQAWRTIAANGEVLDDR